MSYELFVQRFEDGDAGLMTVAAFRRVWGPFADRRDPRHDYWHVLAPDDGEADLYARLGADTFDSLMISHFSEGKILDLLVDFITAADAVVLPPGCPTLMAHEGQRRHLPEELRADAVVVQSGPGIRQVLRAG